jgi:hypothetical protein
MRLSLSAYVAVLNVHNALAFLDTYISISTCNPNNAGPPMTAFPQCDYLVNTTYNCNKIDSRQDYLNCMCNQRLFDSIFE